MEFFHSHPLLCLFGLFLGGIGLWHIWDLRIRPLFIPRAEINALADTLIERHGPEAERVAYGEESHAWYYCDVYEQGKWRRVRRELWRRHKRGEWE
jgi:hypothetical protein